MLNLVPTSYPSNQDQHLKIEKLRKDLRLSDVAFSAFKKLLHNKQEHN